MNCHECLDPVPGYRVYHLPALVKFTQVIDWCSMQDLSFSESSTIASQHVTEVKIFGSSVISVGKKAPFLALELRTPCGQPVDFTPPSLAG